MRIIATILVVLCILGGNIGGALLFWNPFSGDLPPVITLGKEITPEDLDEHAYCKRLAKKYNVTDPKYIERTLQDGSRVDLLSREYSYEVDWSPKHYQAVGQAIHYSILTGRKPAIILLVKDPAKEWRHLVRSARICGHLGIALHIEEVTQ